MKKDRLEYQINLAGKRLLIDWLVNPSHRMPPDENTTFKEINEALDDLEEIIRIRRKQYPR